MHFNGQKIFAGRAFLAATIALAIGLILVPPRADAAERIAVLVSSSEAPFEETLAAFQEQLAKKGIAAEYAVYRLARDPSLAEKAVTEAKQNGARLIFTLGSLGTEVALRRAPDIPVVASLVLRTDYLKDAQNATGIGLEFPIETQFHWMQTVLPAATNIGVLYNPLDNDKRIGEARRVARTMGLHLEAVEVRSPQDVLFALKSLSNTIDVLWGLADTLALSPQMAKHILLFTFRNDIPFVGPSEAWTRAGALYSLDWDYRDLGAQCGDMAIQILGGKTAKSIPPASPRTIRYSLNINTARQMRIKVPEDVLKNAWTVYRENP